MASKYLKFQSGSYQGSESIPEIACKIFNKNLKELTISPAEEGGGGSFVNLDNYIAWLKKEGVQHLTIKTTDQLLSEELTQIFGNPVVSIANYIYFPHQQELPKLKLFCDLREYQEGDYEDLAKISETGFAFTRFYRDPFFEKDLCGKLYREILKTYLSDSSDKTRFTVGLKKEKIVGYLAWKKRIEIIDGKKVKISGSGLGAVSPGNYGCYPAILHQAIDRFGKENDMLEFDGQTDNPQALRIFEFLGMTKNKTTNIFQITL